MDMVKNLQNFLGVILEWCTGINTRVTPIVSTNILHKTNTHPRFYIITQRPGFTVANLSNALPRSRAHPPLTSNLYLSPLTSTFKKPSLLQVLPIALNSP